MFGFEKKKKPVLFEFDLEKELKDDKRQKELLHKAEKHIQELKATLRQGSEPETFEHLGLLLHGYSALLKVLTKVTTTK